MSPSCSEPGTKGFMTEELASTGKVSSSPQGQAQNEGSGAQGTGPANCAEVWAEVGVGAAVLFTPGVSPGTAFQGQGKSLIVLTMDCVFREGKQGSNQFKAT